MTVKIIIKRRVPQAKEKDLLPLIRDLRILTTRQKGYISGETLTKKGYPNNMVVIATWQSMEDWHEWRQNKERKKFEAMLDVFQERPADYEEYLLGTPLSIDEKKVATT